MCNGYLLYVFVALLFHKSIDLLTYNWYFLPQLWNTSDTSEELHIYIYTYVYILYFTIFTTVEYIYIYMYITK